MIKFLPKFKGYSVDVRLKQFRRIELAGEHEFIDFDSPKGDQLLVEYIGSLDADTQEAQEVFKAVVG